MRLPAELRTELLRLALPASLATVLHSLYRLVDQYFVQDLGVAAQSAVAVSGMVAIGLAAFARMVATGTLAVAARRLGEGDLPAAHSAIRAGLRTALVIGAGLALLASLTLPMLVELLFRGDATTVPAERAHALGYLRWIAIGQLVIAPQAAMDAVFFAHKDTRTPLLLESLSIVANCALNALLIPRLGTAGAGLATALSALLALTIGLALLRARGIRPLLLGHAPWPVARRILAIGLPTGIAIIIYSLVYQALVTTTFAHFDAGGRSALGIGFGIESMFYSFFWGMGGAVAALVGRALGEGRPDLAEAIARTMGRLAFGLGVATSVCFWTLGPLFVGLFTSGEARAANIQYLDILAWAQPFQALQMIYDHTLAGAGLTLPTMVATGVMNTARVPLAHLLAIVLGFGLPGVWWSINLSSFGKLVWSWLLFRQGRWKTHRV